MTTCEHDVLLTAHLQELARAAGFEVSSSQLKRWRRRGLLPRPQQRHPLGARGSLTVWPTGSDRQLIALCALAQRFHRHDALLLAVWWEGWIVEDTALLDNLAARLARHPLSLVDRTGSEDERLDALDEMMSGADIARVRGPLRQALRRVGNDEADRRSFLTAILDIGVGLKPPIEVVDVGLGERGLGELLAGGLGLDGFARQLTEVGDPTTSEDLVEGIVDLAPQVQPMLDHARTVIDSRDIDELCAARDQARSLAKLGSIAHAGLLYDQDGGIGYMGQLMTTDDPDGWTLAVVSLLWLRHRFPDNVQALVAAVEHAAAVALVLNAIPVLNELVREADGDQDLLSDLVGSRPDLREAIHNYLAEHPDIASLVDTSR